MDIVNAHIKLTFDGYNAERMLCNDGFSMSVQASRYHYCCPRENDAFPYTTFEIGFPSKRIPEANEYAEEPKRHTKTVFGYVPLEVVLKIIKKHGGLKPIAVKIKTTK